MLLSSQEMAFDFKGACFNLDSADDRAFLAWACNQFLYGEVTGIQIGHWLYNAPDLKAARFLARQAIEEFQHIDNFTQIIRRLGHSPGRAHFLTRFLASGMMPASWEEHVALEMAQGEGMVLLAFYAMIDTIPDLEVKAILQRAVKQEEGHVAFGEEYTMLALKKKPGLRRRLLGLSIISLLAVRLLAHYMNRQKHSGHHPVLLQLPEFLLKIKESTELRFRRMGLCDRPFAEISGFLKMLWILEAYLFRLARMILAILSAGFLTRPKRLTDSYLRDSSIDPGSA